MLTVRNDFSKTSYILIDDKRDLKVSDLLMYIFPNVVY